MSITGQCLCGGVRYESSEPPIVTRVCWCGLCQKIGAGSATVNVFFQTATFKIQGALHDHVSIADSGNVMHRRFCPTCGTAMFTEAENRPAMIGVRAGTLDDPSVVKPSMTIWTSAAPVWAAIDPNLPSYEKGAPPVG